GQLTDQMFEIRKLAGIPPGEPLSLVEIWGQTPNSCSSEFGVCPQISILRSEAELIESALRSRPDLQAARLREALADAGVALARSQATPNVTGSVRYAREPNVSRFATGTQPRAFEKENVLDFGISIPLPFANREQGNIREASSKSTQA